MQSCTTSLAAAYVDTINRHDAAGFFALFAADAVVDDNHREFRGRDAIREWSEREIFAANVSLEVLDETQSNAAATIITKVDGNFDRTGLPDPVVISQCLEIEDGHIQSLTCRLVGV